MTENELNGKPYAGNLHVRFEKGDVAPATRGCLCTLRVRRTAESSLRNAFAFLRRMRRGPLLYKKKLMMAATMIGAFVCTITLAQTDDPVYITGATYLLDGDTLTVSSGDGILVLQTPSTVTNLRIEEGASLKIGIDNPFGTNHVLHVLGTLDLNGKTFTALRFANSEGMANALRTNHGRIINTSAGDAEITLASSASSFYYGIFEELPGRITIVSSLNRPLNITGLWATNIPCNNSYDIVNFTLYFGSSIYNTWA